jgi:hypothetical protein
MPSVVRAAVYNYHSWVVGSSAKFLIGSQDNVTDWDVIVPVIEWPDITNIVPYGTKVNTLGGLKVIDGDTSIDIWPEDLGHFLMTITEGYDKIAVQPRKRLVVSL